MATITVEGELYVIDDGSVVNFIQGQPQGFYINPNQSSENAVAVADVLMSSRHPSIARVLPVHKVNETDTYLVWELLGNKLQEINGTNLVTQNHRIKFFYQDVLGTLFSVTRYMIDKDLSWTYDISNIYVTDNANSRISLVKFTKGKTSFDDHCAGLANLIMAINEHSNYKSGSNTEMQTLLKCLDPGERGTLSSQINWKKKIRQLPLFFSPSELSTLICRVSEYASGYNYSDMSLFYPPIFTEMVYQLEADPLVIKLKKACDDYEEEKKTRKEKKQEQLQGAPPKIGEGTSNPQGVGSKHKDDRRLASRIDLSKLDMLTLIRKSISHFHSMKQPGINNPEAMVTAFENLVPDLLTVIVKMASDFEFSKPHLKGKLIPRKSCLDEMFGDGDCMDEG